MYTLRENPNCSELWWSETVLTAVAGRLQTVVGQLTPAHGEDVPGVILTPVIERSSPAIKHDEYLVPSHLSDGSGTDEVGILPVHRFQFHSRFKEVLSRFGRLLRHSQTMHIHIKKHWTLKSPVFVF